MELNEIKDKRDKLDLEICNLISKFQKETGVNVEEVRVVLYGKDFMGINAIEISTKLERI